MEIEIMERISIYFFVLFILFFILAIFIYIKFDIRKIYGEISGKTAKKTIEAMQHNNVVSTKGQRKNLLLLNAKTVMLKNDEIIKEKVQSGFHHVG